MILSQEFRSIEENIEVTGTSDLCTIDKFERFDLCLQRFGNVSRVLLFARDQFYLLGQVERDWKGQVSEFRFRRNFGDDLIQSRSTWPSK